MKHKEVDHRACYLQWLLMDLMAGILTVEVLFVCVSVHLSLRTLSSSLPAASACVAAGIANVDTRAITMRLRDTGCLNGVICDDLSVPVEELVSRCKSWTIVGKDLIKEVRKRFSTCRPACLRLAKLQSTSSCRLRASFGLSAHKSVHAH